MTLIFPSGSEGGDRLSFSIPIIDDNIAEYQERFQVRASTSGSGIGVYSRTTYTEYVYIIDNDRKFINSLLLKLTTKMLLSHTTAFIVSFEQPSYTVMEGDSVEVCLIPVTNPERVHQFNVQFYTLHDYDSNSSAATGISVSESVTLK